MDGGEIRQLSDQETEVFILGDYLFLHSSECFYLKKRRKEKLVKLM